MEKIISIQNNLKTITVIAVKRLKFEVNGAEKGQFYFEFTNNLLQWKR